MKARTVAVLLITCMCLIVFAPAQAAPPAGERKLQGHTGAVLGLAFAPDGEMLASGAQDGTVRLWRVDDGTLLRTLAGHTGDVFSVGFSPDGKTLASGAADNSVRLWRVDDGKLLHTLDDHTGAVRSVAFAPDGKTLASGAADDTVQLWQVDDGKLLRTLAGHTGGVYSVAFAPDGKSLASGAADNSVRMWRVGDGKLLRTLAGHTGAVHSVAFAPDGKTLASGADDAAVRLWQVSDGSQLHILALDYNIAPIVSIAFEPDGAQLVAWQGYFLSQWQIKDGALLQRVKVDQMGRRIAPMSTGAASPDGVTLASGAADFTVRLWPIAGAFAKAATTPSAPSVSVPNIVVPNVVVPNIVVPNIVVPNIVVPSVVVPNVVVPNINVPNITVPTVPGAVGNTVTPAALPTPTASTAPGAAVQSGTPEVPVGPSTGLLDRYGNETGTGELNVKNGTNGDGVVILADLDDKPLLAAYIRSGESYSLTGIPDGEYRLFFSKGERWDDEKKAFTRRVSRQRFEDTFLFTSTATSYSAWEVTLYGVAGGNAGAEDVAESQFPTLP